MTATELKKHDFFLGFLQSVIFDKNDLEMLKSSITKLYSGDINPIDLKKQILESRTRILKKILEKLPDFIDVIFQNKSDPSELITIKKELEEKKEFLLEIASEVNSLHEKVI